MDATNKLFFLIVFGGSLWLIMDELFGNKKVGDIAKAIVSSIQGG